MTKTAGQLHLMKIFQHLTFGLSLASQMVLWLAGILAIAGLLWREPPDIGAGRNSIAVLVFTVWVGFLIFLSRISQQPKNVKNRNIFWIPVLLIGFLLPFPLPVLYISLLGIAEIFRRLPTRKMYKKIAVPPIADNSDQEDSFDDSVTQKIVRRFAETGKDRLEGTFLVEFQDDQLTATIHIPFCPVFESDPNIEVFLLDDVDVKWNIFKPRNFGVRIDLKRNSCEIQQIHIMVVAE
ncbi:MAG: hypothetical protein LBL62_09035 [Planctomycetaceae bacterium]|jgi:hypothetical protein|nr:hypothetical protein [Planctomycetaceae bacterium]